MQPEGGARRRDRLRGLTIVGTAFLVGLSVSWWARTRSGPPTVDAPAPPTTVGIVGYPGSVDLVATLDAAQKLTPRTQIHGISAYGVRSDGTVNLKEPGSRVRYAFGSARGEGPQPPRPPGTLPRRDSCGHQNVHLRDDGLVADPDQPFYPCVQQRGEALPGPHCGPREVWQAALRKGIPGTHRAVIEYFRSDAGPAWRFTVPGIRQSFTLYGDCERELSGGEAVGSVP